MGKIFAFIITFPIAAFLLIKSIAFFEYDVKQRHIINMADALAYKVKLTGQLTQDDYDEFKDKLNRISRFNDNNIKFKKGIYLSDGTIGNITDYVIGETLTKGDVFIIYLESDEVSNFSKVQNMGISADDNENLRYKAKIVCRIERLEGE